MDLDEADAAEEDYNCNPKAVLTPQWVAAAGLQAMSTHFDEFSAVDLCMELSLSSSRFEKEGEKQLKDILLSQTQILNAMFNKMLYQSQLEDDPKYYDITMSLALKAQKQCRTTIESLNRLINPPPQPVFNQTNIDSTSVSQYSYKFNFMGDGTCEKKNVKNQLLEASNGKRMDPRTTSKAISYDSQMATLGAFYGPQDHSREKEGSYAWV